MMLVEGEYIITATLNISLTRLDCIWLAGVNGIQNSLHFIDLFTIKKMKRTIRKSQILDPSLQNSFRGETLWRSCNLKLNYHFVKPYRTYPTFSFFINKKVTNNDLAAVLISYLCQELIPTNLQYQLR